MMTDLRPMILAAVLVISGLAMLMEVGTPMESEDGIREASNEESLTRSDPISELSPTRSYLKPAPWIEGLEYAAIGREDFRDELQPLLNWKTQKGVKAVFFSLEDVNSSYWETGKDTPEVVRDFLRSLKNRNPGLDWVLLAGDGEDIPPRNIFVNGSAEDGWKDPDNYVPSDMYYAGLDPSRAENDWDLNDNGIYGENYLVEDKKFEEKIFLSDIYVGRFPASTESEMETMVRKQLSYELDPPPGPWADSMLLAGSLMDVPNDPALYQPYKDNAYELVLKVEEELPEHVTPFHLVDYPQIEYGGYNVMFDTLNRSSFESYYESGFSTVLIACHGDPYNGNCTNYKGEGGGRWSYERDYENHFTYDMAGTIENGEKLPLVYISSCASTPFQEVDDTNMERLLTNPDGGAIALIGATVDTYRGEFRPDPEDPNSTYSFGNWWLAQEYFRLMHSGMVRPGQALYEQKWNYRLHLLFDLGKTLDIDKYSKIFNIDTLAYNLIGDPEGPIWLASPKDMTVTFPSEFDHEIGFAVYVNDSQKGPIHNAVVTITDPEDPELYHTVVTGADGIANLDPDISRLGNLRIVVTKDGYIPKISTIEATSSWDVCIDHEITLAPPIPIFGEPFKATFTIHNHGENPVENLFIFWSWYDTEVRVAMNDTLTNETEKLLPGKNITFEATIDWRTGDLQVLTAWIKIFPEVLESDNGNNLVSRSFKINHPLVMNLMSDIQMEEDRSFSDLYGRMLDLIGENRIVDLDGPKPISVTGVVESSNTGNISLVQNRIEQSFDIIPAPDWSGVANLTFHATDGAKALSGTVRVNVLEIPDQPRFLQYPRVYNGSEDRRGNFSVMVYDVDSHDIRLESNFEWINIQRVHPGHYSLFNVSVLPTDQVLGDQFIELIANDSVTKEVLQVMTIHVSPTNDPPMIISPFILNFSKGDEIIVEILYEDPDGDFEFNITVLFEDTLYSFNTTIFTIDNTADLEVGEYKMVVTIDDGNVDGTSTHTITINIKEEDKENYTFVVLVLVGLILSFLFIYGLFLRLQERRQKKMLDSVGTTAPLEARPLSEKDFKKNKRGRGRKEEGLPMPPAPLEVEGAIARGETSSEEEDRDIAQEQDLESDIDDIISEMFS